MVTRLSRSLLGIAFVACLAGVSLWPVAGHAQETCGLGDACSSDDDYCRFVSIFQSLCTPRVGSRGACVPPGQGICQSGLVCDARFECRHSPPDSGEFCGAGVPCVSQLACDATIGGRCAARGNAGQTCTGTGQGTCVSGLVCDFFGGICRHNPPQTGEPCAAGVSCAGNLVCSGEISGVCEARGQGTDPCYGFGQGSCASSLLCDVLRECRHAPGQSGELCGAFVPCVSTLGCSADVGGRCEERDEAGEVCSDVGQGSCQAGLLCDANRICRHDPPQLGESCGTGVPCIASLGCSADVGGVCEPRDVAGETCSGFGQGSCESGLVCDALRVCRHDPPLADEPCGIGVSCGEGMFCQVGSERCRILKTAGEGCSAVNLCRERLSCEPCFTDGCDYPLQCFPNPNDGAITKQQCLALYSARQHQTAKALGLALTYGAGDGASAFVSESQQFGVAYGPDGRYGCFTEVCAGIDLDVEIAAFVCVGFNNTYAGLAGSSWEVFEEAEIPGGVFAFSTSQTFPLISLSPLQLGPLDGTEDCLSAGVSPDLGLIPVSAGSYVCETVLDTVIGGAGQPLAPICGNGTTDAGEGCDDGDTLNGDGCSASCTLEILCGNGALNTGETCDDGNTLGGDGCSARCRVEPVCGDGNQDPGEACDDGGTVAGDGCSAGCTIEPACGNGLIEPGEACDDGGNTSGDGCSAICEVELPGDIDLDRDVDRSDSTLLLGFRNRPASACPKCDLDRDGLITVLDGRKLALLCTRPKCATQ